MTTSSILRVSSFTIVSWVVVEAGADFKNDAELFGESTERDCMTFAPEPASSNISR